MKNLLSGIGATFIGALGLFCCYIWMQPGTSLIQILCLSVGVITVGVPVYGYWYEKLKN